MPWRRLRPCPSLYLPASGNGPLREQQLEQDRTSQEEYLAFLKKHRALSTRNTSGLAAPDHTVPYGTVLSEDAFPGTSCQATIGVSLRDVLAEVRNRLADVVSCAQRTTFGDGGLNAPCHWPAPGKTIPKSCRAQAGGYLQ